MNIHLHVVIFYNLSLNKHRWLSLGHILCPMHRWLSEYFNTF